MYWLDEHPHFVSAFSAGDDGDSGGFVFAPPGPANWKAAPETKMDSDLTLFWQEYLVEEGLLWSKVGQYEDWKGSSEDINYIKIQVFTPITEKEILLVTSGDGWGPPPSNSLLWMFLNTEKGPSIAFLFELPSRVTKLLMW